MTDSRLRLTDKVALVTGAARGLGEAISRLYAREGADVLIADVREELGAETAAAIDASEVGRCRFVRLDVTSEPDWTAAVAYCEQELGPVDILVSNAYRWAPGTIVDVTMETWRDAHAVILDGAFFGIRAVLPAMRARGIGVIIGISSTVGGDMAAPDFAAYQSAKGALTSLIRHVGVTYAREGVRANTIHPGSIRTPSQAEAGFAEVGEQVARGFPIGRIAEPEDVAAGAVFLASDEARYMTASRLVIDGGSIALLGGVHE